jgi:UDP-GlcNAc:undecaprenyl-phosphate GlcNAc-1-phosphate transferase
MFELKLVMIFLAAFLIVFSLVPQTMRLACKLEAIDRPDGRKVHHKPMPRLGGVAIFAGVILPAGFIAGFVMQSSLYWGVVFGGIIAFAVGFLDDVYQLSPLVKLAGQVAAAMVAIGFGILVEFMTNPFGGLIGLGYLSIPLTLIWIVGITNAINLIDGLDGLAAGVASIAALTMGVAAYLQAAPMVFVLAMVILGAVLGFLPYNFYPARTFMGDGGSNFLGFMLACLSVMGAAKSTALFSIFVPIVILGIPIFDTFFAIVRRFHNKASILKPDKNHLHHRLLAMGLNHRTSVLVIYAISGLFGLTAILLNIAGTPQGSLILVVLLLFVLAGARKLHICAAGGVPEPAGQSAEHL